jgi:hypothetical protein
LVDEVQRQQWAEEYQRQQAEITLAEENLKWELRDFTSNLLRVTRGAGKPHEIPSQIRGLAVLIDHAMSLPGRSYTLNLSSMLRYRSPLEEANLNQENHDISESSVISGALQVVASRLAGQLSQESVGRGEMYDGINSIIRARRKRDFG